MNIKSIQNLVSEAMNEIKTIDELHHHQLDYFEENDV